MNGELTHIRRKAAAGILCALIVVLGLAVPGRSQTSKTTPSPSREQRILREGISVAFGMEPLEAARTSPASFREGELALFRFTITDAATGSPVANASPAAWLSWKSGSPSSKSETCQERVKELLSGSIFSNAEVDLNVYYVLAMNNDATISVVDPRFGFGGSRLLAMVGLKSPGEDWALTADQTRLFVSMPESNQVAVVETTGWKVTSNLDLGPHPARMTMQPDEQCLWVTYEGSASRPGDSGVGVITPGSGKVEARIPTGRGPHEIACSADNRFVFVTNREEGTLSIVDARLRKKIKDLRTGKHPTHVAYSTLSQMVYVVSESDGTIAVVDGRKRGIVARMKAEPGLGQIRFEPSGRLGFVVNPEKDLVHIIDAASNRIVQTGDLERGPDKISFSNELAYFRHRDSEVVLMVPLKEVGVEGRPVPVVDFPGGELPFGRASRPSPADSIVQAPGANAVLVANPGDRAIYYYKEGMAAPMGNFSNYAREPRAVLVVDRTLKQRMPGTYQTIANLPTSGLYDVAFFLDTPRVVHCFEVAIEPNPSLEGGTPLPPVVVLPLFNDPGVIVGEQVRLRFKLINPASKMPRLDLKDVRALTLLAPGVWQRRHSVSPTPVEEGIYEFDFVAPQAGVYYVYLEIPSLGLSFNNPQYFALEAKSAERGATP